jgi:hypothetical protein
MLPLVWTQGHLQKEIILLVTVLWGNVDRSCIRDFIIPVMYVIFQYLHEKMPSRKKKRLLKKQMEEELLALLLIK